MSAPNRRPVRREPRQPPKTAPATDAKTGPWLISGKGLKTYTVGLGIRLIFTVFFMILALVFLREDSMAPKILTVFFSIMSVATGFAMLSGLGRFARQPTDSPGRGTARFAAAMLAITVALELFLFVLAAMTAAAGPEDQAIAERFASYLGPLWRWAAALWLAHVGATIVAMWKLNPLFEGADDNRRFIMPAMVLVGGVLAFFTWNLLPSLGVAGALVAVTLTALTFLTAMATYLAAIDNLASRLCAAGVTVPKTTVRATK